MKKIIKKYIKETLENKKLEMVYVYLSNYMTSLDTDIKKYGDIYFYESFNFNRYVKFWFQKNNLRCWIDKSFWDEFSEDFFLDENDIQLLIKRWFEDTLQLKDIYAVPGRYSIELQQPQKQISLKLPK